MARGSYTPKKRRKKANLQTEPTHPPPHVARGPSGCSSSQSRTRRRGPPTSVRLSPNGSTEKNLVVKETRPTTHCLQKERFLRCGKANGKEPAPMVGTGLRPMYTNLEERWNTLGEIRPGTARRIQQSAKLTTQIKNDKTDSNGAIFL